MLSVWLQVFFARAPKLITEEQLREVFGRYGSVEDVSIYRPYPTASESMVTHKLKYASKQEVLSACLCETCSKNLSSC